MNGCESCYIGTYSVFPCVCNMLTPVHHDEGVSLTREYTFMYVYVTYTYSRSHDEGVSLTREYSVCVCNMLTPVHHEGVQLLTREYMMYVYVTCLLPFTDEGVSLTREYSVCVCNSAYSRSQMKVWV